MKKLLKNCKIVNVFLDEIVEGNILIKNDKIIGIGDYEDNEADEVFDIQGKVVCPGFIDGHIHIESTMLTPYELAKCILPHGTTGIMTDPHEIANVAGADGVKYMLSASKDIGLRVYVMLPSCVPATPFDESGAILTAEDLKPLYSEERVLGLAEMMNFPGVIYGDKATLDKIEYAAKNHKPIDGHAPMLSGKGLDKYISAGIGSEHEATSVEEAIEKLSKGQWIMIREGTAAKNLEALMPLFQEPYNRRCLLASDDRHPDDLISEGDIDNIVRKAIKLGANPIAAIRMASLNAATRFGFLHLGAIAPGYKANLLVLTDLDTVSIDKVMCDGNFLVSGGKLIENAVKKPEIPDELRKKVANSFNVKKLTPADFMVPERKGEKARAIEVIPGSLLTKEYQFVPDFSGGANGIDLKNDLVKLAVIERHKGTGHIGIGFIHGLGLKKGAIASSVSHDSHNLIVIGTNEEDMAKVASHVMSIGGGNAICVDGKITGELRLEIGGLMSERPADTVAAESKKITEEVYNLGVPSNISPFMNMAFVSLSVIPSLKMTTHGLIDVDKWKLVDMYV